MCNSKVTRVACFLWNFMRETLIRVVLNLEQSDLLVLSDRNRTDELLDN